jgi:hypothetical protein
MHESARSVRDWAGLTWLLGYAWAHERVRSRAGLWASFYKRIVKVKEFCFCFYYFSEADFNVNLMNLSQFDANLCIFFVQR